MTSEDIVMVSAFTLIGGLVFFLGFYKMRRYRIIRDTPRSKIRSMAMGIVEIHGSVEAERLIKSPFSKTDCVYYKWEIKEYRKSGTSKSGSSSYRWQTVGQGDRRVPFFATDETGKALVDPDRADFMISSRKVFSQKGQGLLGSFRALPKLIKALKNFDPDDPTSLDIEGEDLVPMEAGTSFGLVKVGDRRYYEYYIVPGDRLFVLGTAANDSSAPDNVVIRRSKNEKTFIISDKSEKGVLKNIKKLMIVCFVMGGIFVVAGIVMFLQMQGVIPKG